MVEMVKNHWNQIQEYIWHWSSILMGDLERQEIRLNSNLGFVADTHLSL